MELGIGVGMLTEELDNVGLNVSSIDASPDIRLTRQKVKKIVCRNAPFINPLAFFGNQCTPILHL